jgi:hypothetical protein
VSSATTQSGSAQPRALPPPALDVCELERLFPGLDAAEAQRAVLLGTLAVAAALWPNELPAPPLPVPVTAVLLSVSARIMHAGTAGQAEVVSESLGAYSYRRETSGTESGLLWLNDAELEALEPWRGGRKGAYELDVACSALGWPIDWWQRDYDDLSAYWDAQTFPGGSDPEALSGIKP